MRPTDEIQIVSIQEFRDNIRTECERNASVVLAPSSHIFVRIRPGK